MNINEKYIPEGHPNRPGIPLTCTRSYVFHYTANDSPTADDVANASYMGRSGWYRDSNGKAHESNGDLFYFGSAQIIADMDSITLTMPLTEVAWGCGDNTTALAQQLFGGLQNYMTINVEIANNDAIPDSNDDWDAACNNALEFVAQDIVTRNTDFDYNDSYAFLRHYDVSGKICPAPFIRLDIAEVDPRWTDFKNKLISRIEELKSQSSQQSEQSSITKTPILGTAVATVDQLEKLIHDNNSDAPYLAQIFKEEGEKEGVRWDIAVCQSIHETGYFEYGGIVTADMNNYSGLGALNSNTTGQAAKFDEPRLGVRAQIQHLKAYAGGSEFSEEIIDPRYSILVDNDLVGVAPNWEDLSGRWAYPGYDKNKYNSLDEAFNAGDTYGQIIVNLLNDALQIVIPTTEVPQSGSKYFNDVPVGHWAAEYIDKAKEYGLISGESPGIFGMQDDKLRLTTVAVRLYDKLHQEIENINK